MAYSKRDYTTREERERMVIEKGNPKNSCKSKLSEYLSQENVKCFNRIVVSKNFDRLREETKLGRKQIFSSNEECLNEIEDYFKLCDKQPQIVHFFQHSEKCNRHLPKLSGDRRVRWNDTKCTIYLPI